jgi:hypothetical protein
MQRDHSSGRPAPPSRVVVGPFDGSANCGRFDAMKELLGALIAAVLLSFQNAAAQAPSGLGTEELGMSPRELVQSIERVEELISKCMRGQGFQYIAVDHNTVRAGMSADKKLPGLSEEQFISKYGFGVATMYTGQPPQLASGYNPAKVGLGEQNVEFFKNLSAADQVAYNLALLGDNNGATFAVALETENLASTGGCTRKAVEQVFKPEQLKATYYNPQDALINKDPRMKAALERYSREMKKLGYDYSHPDEVEPDVRTRLAGLSGNGKIPVEQMSPEQRAALKKLQDYEIAVASKSFKLQEEIIVPVEERIQQEIFSRKVQ